MGVHWIDPTLDESANPNYILGRAVRVSNVEKMDGCGHDDCRCQALLMTFQSRPRSKFREFPLLEKGELTDEAFSFFIARLQRQFEEVVFAFQQLIPRSISTIHDFHITPKAVVDFLENISATCKYPECGLRQQSLFHQVLSQLREMKSTDEVLQEAYSYFSAFTHHVLTDIVAGFGNKETSQISVRNYIDKLNVYNQRPIAQAPCLYTSPRKHGRAFLTFYLDWDPNKVTIHEMDNFRLKASSICKMTHYVLMLISVEMKDSAMVQTYQIPASLTDILFPLDEQQLAFFESRKVLKVECCGTSVLTKSGETFFRNLEIPLAMEDEASSMTPPLTPPLVFQASPIPDVIGTVPGYQLVSKKANISLSHLELTKPGVEGKNYIVLVSEYYRNAPLIAVLLANHVMSKRKQGSYGKSLIVTNTHRQAIQLETDLKGLLPDADITCFTGATKVSIATKFVHDATTTTICTAGKLLSEITSKSVSFKMMTQLIIVDCEYVHYEASLQDLMQNYVRAKCDGKLDYKLPQIVGLTQSPSAGAYAIQEEVMIDHIISLCGLLDASDGLLATNTIQTQIYSQRKLYSKVEVKVLHSRDVMKDCLSLLSVEMGLIEERMEVVCLFEKGTEEYVTFMQEKKASLISLQPLPNKLAQEYIAQLDLLVHYSQAMSVCQTQGSHQLVQFIGGSSQQRVDETTLSVTRDNALSKVVSEMKDIINKEESPESQVANYLSETFKKNSRWRGLLFVDSEEKAQSMLTKLSDKIKQVSPIMLSDSYLSVFSKRTKRKKDLEMVKRLCEEESRLLVVPFSIENCTELSLIDLPDCDFMIRFQKQNNDFTKHMSELEYVMTFISCSRRRPLYVFSEELQVSLVEKSLDKIPTGEEFQTKMVEQQRLSVRKYIDNSIRIRHSHSSKQPKFPPIDQIVLRCKKCRTYACHGNQLFTLFEDGAQNHVIPFHGFRRRMSLKRFHPKRKVPKRISRLRKVCCSNCDSDWGMLCYFPKRGIELPVLKSKNFVFSVNGKMYVIKLWTDVFLSVPPLTASSKYCKDQSDSD